MVNKCLQTWYTSCEQKTDIWLCFKLWSNFKLIGIKHDIPALDLFLNFLILLFILSLIHILSHYKLFWELVFQYTTESTPNSFQYCGYPLFPRGYGVLWETLLEPPVYFRSFLLLLLLWYCGCNSIGIFQPMDWD